MEIDLALISLASATDPLSSELFSAIPGLLQLFHHERKTGDTERLGASPRTTT